MVAQVEVVRALIYALALIFAVSATVWWLLSGPAKMASAAGRRFALGNTLMLIGALMITQRDNPAVPAWMSFHFASLLVLLGALLLRSGAGILFRISGPWRPLAWLAGLTILIAVIVWPPPGGAPYLSALFSLIAGAIAADAGYSSYRLVQKEYGVRIAMLASGLFTLTSLVMLGRTLHLAWRLLTDQPFEARPLEIGLGFAWMCLALGLIINVTLVALVLLRLVARIQELASRDPLTQLLNRRAIQECMEREAASSRRGGGDFAVVMFDIDHFKRINDEFGHEAGDEALCHVARLAKRTLRAHDSVARFGGEEFLVVLPRASAESAQTAAERLRLSLEQSPLLYRGRSITLTASFAWGLSRKGELDIDLVDRALYRAKERGRNCVEAVGDLITDVA